MKLFGSVLALCCIVVAVSCASPPAWPTQYSTGFDTQFTRMHHNVVGRWFFDENLQSERIDTSGQWGWDVRMVDYKQGKAWNVIHLDEKSLHCSVETVTDDMPIPDFKNFTSKGQTTVQGETCDWWTNTESTGVQNDYYDISSTTDPMKLTSKGHMNEFETLFFTFDRGAQDPTVFNLTYQFPGLQCVPKVAPNSEMVHMRQALARASLHAILSPVLVHRMPRELHNFRFHTERLVLKHENATRAVRTVIDGKASWFCCNSRAESGCGCGQTPNGACGPCGASDMICATRFGACGMHCTVTNTSNGRTVNVVRGDYGPAEWTGRDIDMNCGAAQQLDMISAGVVPAHISCDG